MALLRVTAFLCGTYGSSALDLQKPQVAFLESQQENSTSHTQAAESQHVSGVAIQPSLAPKSDKKFFGKDYPDDLRPTIDKAPKWSYPYPKVQSDSKYDVDYVKDENNDGGHWKAQMDYDEIKMKYIKQQAVVREAALREGMEKDEAMKAAKVKDDIWLRKNNADVEVSKAAEEAAAAAEAYDKATAEEKAKEWEAAKKEGKSKELFEAEQRVERAEAYLKNCEKAVADARADLARVESEEAAKESAAQQAKDGNVQAAKANQAGKADAAKTKQASLSDKQAKAAAAKQEADAAKVASDKEEAEDQTALRTLAQEQAKLDRLHDALKEAEARLRKFRGDPAPAQLNAEMKSGANPTTVFPLVSLLVGFLVCVA